MMISVVIPVYNNAKHLPRCLNSLLAQTYKDWEAVCVDDGSNDGSGAILDRYAAADSRIKVIHTPNGGVSAARNLAMGLVSGEYLLFVDSDDFIHPRTMEICIGEAVLDGSDLVAFTYDRRYRLKMTIRHFLPLPEPKKVRFPEFGAIGTFCTEDIYSIATEYSSRPGVDGQLLVKHCQPWRCMYRTELVRDIRFIEGIMYEDFTWWGCVLQRIRKATVNNLPLYYYYPNFSGYVNSAKQEFRISSLREAIRQSRESYAGADKDKAAAWEEYFLTPFEEKLRKKEAAASKKACKKEAASQR